MTMSKSFSFKRGWDQVPVSLAKEVRAQLMEVCGVRYPSSFYYRLKGKCEPTFSEGLEVERIFKKYGITDIWGE